MILIRSLIFMLFMWTSLVVYAPLTLLTFPFPYLVRYRVVTAWPKFHVWLLKVVCNLRYEVEGLEHLPKSAAIVLAKHQSTYETFALPYLFPPYTWVLKRELMWIPFFGWGMALLRPIAINRSAGRKAMEQLVSLGRKRLASGLWVVIFPEGTRIPAGKKGRYRLGGAVLAHETGYPVVPVAHNAGSFWPKRSLVVKPGVVKIVIGPVIDSKGKSVEEIKQQTENWIETTMQRLEGRTGEAELVTHSS
jgi:1-acyl-sn-glycerol-3-phosphate acyltransferase